MKNDVVVGKILSMVESMDNKELYEIEYYYSIDNTVDLGVS